MAVVGALAADEPLTVDGLFQRVAPLLSLRGWRDADGAPFHAHTLFPAMTPLLLRAAGRGSSSAHSKPAS